MMTDATKPEGIAPHMDEETIARIIMRALKPSAENRIDESHTMEMITIRLLMDIRDELYKMNRQHGVQRWGPKI